MIRIRITPPKGDIATRDLAAGPTVVGRHEDCDLVLEGKLVSRRHALFTVDGERLTVSDLGSHNGTWVNGQRLLGPRHVGHADRIQLGGYTVHLLAEADVPWYDASEEIELASFVEGSQVQDQGVLRDAFTANPILSRLREIGAIMEGSHNDAVHTSIPSFDPLSLFSQITELIHSAHTMESFLDEILGLACQVTAAETGAVVMVEPDGTLRPVGVRRLTKNDEAEVPISRTVVNAALNERAVITSHDATTDARFEQQQSIAIMGLRSVLCAPLDRGTDVPGVLYITREPGGFRREEQMTVAAISHLAALGIERARLREQMEHEEKLRRALSRFHSPDVVETLLARQELEGMLKLEPAEATVIFADICGFTTLAERVTPTQLGTMLNEFYVSMGEVVAELGGTVDKFIGDCVMALFGVPISKGNDAVAAVEAAVQMQVRFEKLQETAWKGHELRLRIGVNTGSVVAGGVGSERRWDYTALGDAVNVAQRLEGIARPGQILAGPRTAEYVRGAYHLHSLSKMTVKGRAAPVEVFEILGRKSKRHSGGSEDRTRVTPSPTPGGAATPVPRGD